MQNDESFSETKVSLTLGGKAYLLNFGLHTMRRIEEAVPGFTILEPKIPFFEVVPLLIQKAIDPKDHGWKTEDEFIELYEAYLKEPESEDVLNKIPLAFQNAMGFTNRLFNPVVDRLTNMARQMEEESKKQEKKKGTKPEKAQEAAE